MPVVPRPASLLGTLSATRKFLRDNQRRFPRRSRSWASIEHLLREIDQLGNQFTAGSRSNLLNLNRGSELAFNGQTRASPEILLDRRRVETSQMMKDLLEEFSHAMRSKGRIGKYDVERLQQEILVDGILSRDEADILIALDRDIGSTHFSWAAFFISAVTQFVVWESGTAGYIDADKSNWLLQAFTSSGRTDRGRRALIRIAQEADCFDEAFFTSSGAAPGPNLSLSAVLQLAA